MLKKITRKSICMILFLVLLISYVPYDIFADDSGARVENYELYCTEQP